MSEKVECKDCSKKFDLAVALQQHVQTKHAEIKPSGRDVKTNKTIKRFTTYLIVALVIIGIGYGIYSFVSANSSVTGSFTKESSKELVEGALLGMDAPDFTLPSSTGNKISLSDYKGKKNVLLYFQEGVMCDPCWKQARDIEKEYNKFQEKDIELLTITVDPLNAVTKNAKRFGITLPVLTDEDLKVSSQYDVLKDSMHPGDRPGHTFVLVDKNGKVVWQKAYFKASGSTEMTMRMQDGSTMTMNMGMDMGTPDSVMYVPLNQLLSDLEGVKLDSLDMSGMGVQNMSAEDHSMCLTPIHNHADFKMYLGGNLLNFSQNNYMDQSNIVHFHKTVKVNPDDVSGLPNGLLIHVHKDEETIGDFLRTLDLPFNLDSIKGLKVYLNGNIQSSGLDYVLKDKDRVLATDSTNDSEIKSQMDSVTDYAVQGKEKNPSLFGGC